MLYTDIPILNAALLISAGPESPALFFCLVAAVGLVDPVAARTPSLALTLTPRRAYPAKPSRVQVIFRNCDGDTITAWLFLSRSSQR